ncbi:MAG: lysophospholipid acyltransferase family protein, partial [Anaerolineae bacterium]
MTDERYAFPYPRRWLARGIARIGGRLLLPLFFRIRRTGRESFPSGGPLLVVGNHVAVMEAVLMAVYTPWQVEVIGAADIPHETISDVTMKFFGFIPVRRGHVDRPALGKALSVLSKGGVIGVFPEGGIWRAGKMRPQTGVAWLSYRGKAPVLPIGFGGTLGALGDALRLKRPQLTMNVGQVLPLARLPDDTPRREYLEQYAVEVMEAVNALVPQEDVEELPQIVDERFELQVEVRAPGGVAESPPAERHIQHAAALAKFLHNPGILKVFDQNLNLDVRALQNIARAEDPRQIACAAASVLAYLNGENPYFLSYRFGPQMAEDMQFGLEELEALARWADEEGYSLHIIAIRRYYSPEA